MTSLENHVAVAHVNEAMRGVNRFSWTYRYTTEQYYAMEALERAFPGTKAKYQDWTHWSEEAEKLSDLFMGNNFIVLDLSHHGVALPKYEFLVTDS